MERQYLIQTLSDCLQETLRLKHVHIEPDDNLMEKLGLDSMGAVEFVIKLEEQFDISIDDEEVQTMNTLNRTADLILGKLEARQKKRFAA